MFAPRLAMTLVNRRGPAAPFLHEGDFCLGIARARSFGYDCVEIHARAPEELDTRRLADALAREGIAVSALGTGRAYVDDGLSLIDPDPIARGEAMRRLLGFIDTAAELGALVIVGCLRGNIAPPGQKEEGLLRLGDAMRRADACAAERGVRLALEAINRYENNYLCSVYDAAAFIEENGLLATGILADTFHMNIEERDIAQALRDNARRIVYVHAADSNRRYPGGGHTDFHAVARALAETGYGGDIGAECLPLPGDAEAAALWLQNMKGYLSRI